MENILANDPCRRFTTGTTVQGRTLRLWFANHSFVLKTEPIDLLTDHRRLIHFFLALSFAPRTVDLGWDPTIVRAGYNCDDDQWMYVVCVDGQFFTTAWLLADFTDQGHAGRWTRVWLVRDCD
ncbi:hypothetical protein GYMLUDRAFT_179780, partial [Collybiopsis luxurians FD-317 M1]